jgi:hypothetical protein
VIKSNRHNAHGLSSKSKNIHRNLSKTLNPSQRNIRESQFLLQNGMTGSEMLCFSALPETQISRTLTATA